MRWMRQIVTHSALIWIRGKELDIRTQIIATLFTELARTAGLARLQCDAVSNGKGFYAFSNSRNNAGAFMPENLPPEDRTRADHSCFVEMYVRAADTSILCLNEQLTVCGLRYIQDVVFKVQFAVHKNGTVFHFHTISPLSYGWTITFKSDESDLTRCMASK